MAFIYIIQAIFQYLGLVAIIGEWLFKVKLLNSHPPFL